MKVILPGLLIAAILVPGQVLAKPFFTLQTKTGCIFYDTGVRGIETWDGACTPGQPLSGHGMLSDVSTGVDGKPQTNFEEVNFIAGYKDGDASYYMQFREADGTLHRYRWGEDTYKMGCKFRNGQLEKDCTPGSGAP